MTEKELFEGVIECLWRFHCFDTAFVYGEDYLIKNIVWIKREFERKIEQMTPADWDMATKKYIEALKETKGGGS